MSTRTVGVVGRGNELVVPDRAVVRVVAAARARDLASAFSSSSEAAELITRVAGRHTEAREIGSSGLSVWPAYDERGQPSGFEARHSLTIGCPNLEAAAGVLDQLANEVGDRLVVEGVSLEVADERQARDRATETAYADAVRQATRLAELAGQALGDVLAIGHRIGEVGAGEIGAGGAGVDAMAVRSTRLEPGETGVQVSLPVVFALVPPA